MKRKKPQVNTTLTYGSLSSEPERIRTFDRLLRREVLYPAELRARTQLFEVSKSFC